MVGAVSDFEWNPETYLGEMLAEVPGYDELEEAVAAAVEGGNVLELGTGTGETALRILTRHPGARWTGIDASEAMLGRARERLPTADLRVQRLEDPLPEGPFDVVVSVLAVHHLDGPAKRDLFARIAQIADTFVLGDLVVPERPEDAVIEVDWVMDLPSSVPEQLEWLREAGFEAEATYVRPDLAVFVARRPPRR
jgi:tRNA (cmo5U34)-methyltransferase